MGGSIFIIRRRATRTGSAATWSRCDVADEPVGRRHERPGLAAQVEAQLHLGHSPVRLHRRARVAFDGQPVVLERTDRRIVHRVIERFHRSFRFRRHLLSQASVAGSKPKSSSSSIIKGSVTDETAAGPVARRIEALASTFNQPRASMTNRRVEVFGPAYLDRVLRVDRPLFDPSLGPPFDQSTDGEWKFTSNRRIDVIDASGYTLEIELPDDWPGPTGEVRLPRPLREGAHGRRRLRGLDWHDDLGGMGAGYAAALHGVSGVLARRRGRPDEPRPSRGG